MKKFHELTSMDQFKAKQNAKDMLLKDMIDGVYEVELPKDATEIFTGALIIKQRGKSDLALEYLKQSKVFMKSVNKLMEAAADVALYPEDYIG